MGWETIIANPFAFYGTVKKVLTDLMDYLIHAITMAETALNS